MLKTDRFESQITNLCLASIIRSKFLFADKSCKCSSETEVKKVKSDKEDSNKQTVTILAVVIGVLSFVMMVSLVYNCKMRYFSRS